MVACCGLRDSRERRCSGGAPLNEVKYYPFQSLFFHALWKIQGIIYGLIVAVAVYALRETMAPPTDSH
jgi:hypothetical protein